MNRNQLCSCGSGKRYKHCHGAVADATAAREAPARAAAAPADPLATLHLALVQQREGRLAAAESLYEQALAGLPAHFDAIHMLGVVKLQLGKFEEGARLLLRGLPLATDEVIGPFKHNLSLCLVGLARRRGQLDALAVDPPPLDRAAPFARAYALPAPAAASAAGVSVVVTGIASAAALQRSLDAVRAQTHAAQEIVAAVDAGVAQREDIAAALAGCGTPHRVVDVGPTATLAAQVNLAAAACEGAYLAFLRAGDRWAPQWLQRMTAALAGFGAQWGYGGLRAMADDGTIQRFGTSKDLDALLRAQDALYVHRTASLGFLSFDPVAAGRNLIVAAPLWRRRGGLPADAADPFLDWAWRTARDEEPAYVDAPDYLIAPGTERLHLHDAFAPMIAPTMQPLSVDRDGAQADAPNPHLRHGLALYWARQWRQMRALQAATMPVEALLGCAAMLGVASAAPATAPVTAGPR